MSFIADALYCLTLIPHYLYHRYFTNKYGDSAPEKLGFIPDQIKPGRKCMWLHAVSVGETLAARTLVRAFEEAHPDWDVRISTTTATGREVAMKNFGEERVFYYPLDCSWMVRRAFDIINPSLIVLMELEVWPNFLLEAQKRLVPVAVSNVRIMERSVRRFKKLRAIALPMLERVSLWLSQSDEYTGKLLDIGVSKDKIETVGSLKYDTVATEIDPDVRLEYRKLFGAWEGETVFVAGSTHAGEDEIVLDAYKAAHEKCSGLK
ncbi:MAG: hypothetical protein JXR97_03655, partial [Planctomycetes bacterium]|nr:hypothetical protein [Planctomycetota bacterium]